MDQAGRGKRATILDKHGCMETRILIDLLRRPIGQAMLKNVLENVSMPLLKELCSKSNLKSLLESGLLVAPENLPAISIDCKSTRKSSGIIQEFASSANQGLVHIVPERCGVEQGSTSGCLLGSVTGIQQKSINGVLQGSIKSVPQGSIKDFQQGPTDNGIVASMQGSSSDSQSNQGSNSQSGSAREGRDGESGCPSSRDSLYKSSFQLLNAKLNELAKMPQPEQLQTRPSDAYLPWRQNSVWQPYRSKKCLIPHRVLTRVCSSTISVHRSKAEILFKNRCFGLPPREPCPASTNCSSCLLGRGRKIAYDFSELFKRRIHKMFQNRCNKLMNRRSGRSSVNSNKNRNETSSTMTRPKWGR